VSKEFEKWEFADFLMFGDERYEFDGEYKEVAGNAKDNLGQHGMHVCMPETEIPAQRLTDVDGQHTHGTAVANEPYDHRGANQVLKEIDLKDIEQESTEKRTRSKGDDREVYGYPQTENEVVIHAGLIQAFE
jgi:hypothetical protein